MLRFEYPSERLMLLAVSWPEPVEKLQVALGTVREKVTNAPVPMITVVDLRYADVFPKPLSDAFVAMLTANNPKIGRSAFLVSEKAILAMQVERVIRESGGASRKTFREQPALEAWVGEGLEALETQAIRAFLDWKA